MAFEQQSAESTLVAHKLPLIWGSPVSATAWRSHILGTNSLLSNPAHAAAVLRSLRDTVRWWARKHLTTALSLVAVTIAELLCLEMYYTSKT